MNSSYDHVLIATSDLSSDRRMIRISAALQEKGCKVLLVGRLLPGSTACQESQFDQHRIQCRYHKGVIFYIEYMLRMYKFLCKIRLRTLTCVDLDTIWVGRLLRIHRSFIWYFDSHEHFVEVPELIGRPLKKWLWQRTAKWCIPKTDERYTVGHSLAQVLSDQYNSSFKVIMNTPYKSKISILTATKTIVTSPFKMIYLGVLNEGRGLTQLIAAMEQLPDCELWLIGEGDLSHQLREQVNLKVHHNRVKFHGVLHEDEFMVLLQKGNLGLNLLTSQSLSYYYSLPNKVFDYIHADLPFLTMNFPESIEIMKQFDCGYIIEDINTNVLIEKIERIKVNYTKDVTGKKSECQKAKELYNWENEKIKLWEMYGINTQDSSVV